MLELKNVVKKYESKAGDVYALNDISVKFPNTGMIFVTGKSGSGKTTLLNTVGGLDDIDGGNVLIDGKDFASFSQSDYDSYRNTYVGFIFQEYNLLPDYTVEKNIKIANELQGKHTTSEEIKEILKKVDLEGYERRKPNELSGGQKQRVAIARALVKNPQIIMADEPTGALDSATGVQVMETLKTLSKEKLILIVSHDLELAEKYADRIIRLIDGKICEDVEITDTEIIGNVFDSGNGITVKSGATLNGGETELLLKAIREKRLIEFSEKLSVRVKNATDTAKLENITQSENAKLINSKMKYVSSAELGIKSLKVKPLRLIFTILLSAIAFAVFGLFDTIASFQNSRVVANIIRTGEYDSLSVSAKYLGENYTTGKSIRISENTRNNLEKTTGYKFKGIYDFDDLHYTNSDINKELTVFGLGSMQSFQGKQYYTQKANGIIEFSADELTFNSNSEITGVDPNGYNLKVLCGTYPKVDIYDNNVADLNYVAITDYLAESLVYSAKYSHNDNIEAETIQELIDTKVSFGSTEYVIKCIVSSPKIPEKYNPVKTYLNASENVALCDDFTTFIDNGIYKCLFVGKGWNEKRKRIYSRASTYLVDLGKTKVDFPELPKTQNYYLQSTATGLQNGYAKYYNIEDLSENKITLFSDVKLENGEVSLSENDALINLKHIDKLFYYEYSSATDEQKTDIKKLEDKITSYNLPTLNDDVLDWLNSYLELIKTVQSSIYDLKTNAFGSEDWSKEKGVNKIIKLTQTDDANATIGTNQVRIVGAYVGVDTDDNKYYGNQIVFPLVMSKSGLQRLNVYTEQGLYSRLVTPLYQTTKLSAKKLSNEITKSSGLVLSWYNNGILEVIDENAEMFKDFTQLFLYVSLVLALFSVFMLFNYISTSIVSKRQTIGVLRALGSGGKDIFSMFITESIIISFINGVLANLIAYFGCFFVNNYIRNEMGLTINLALFGSRQIILIMVASIITGIISSIIPIIKIAKEKPVKLIREP